MSFIDIGSNFTDHKYKGTYFGKNIHKNDISNVLEKAKLHSLAAIIITGGNFKDSLEAVEIAEKYGKIDYKNPDNNPHTPDIKSDTPDIESDTPDIESDTPDIDSDTPDIHNPDKRSDIYLFSTAGVHPTRCCAFEKNPKNYLNKLHTLIKENLHIICAIGEFGIDYDRLQFCPKDVQKKYFEYQLSLVEEFKLPMFLHMRGSPDSGACQDFIDILSRNREKWESVGGVVHSFTGTSSEVLEVMNLSKNLFFGINGCSLKTDKNIQTLKTIPVEKLMIETGIEQFSRFINLAVSLDFTIFFNLIRCSLVRYKTQPCLI
eukprot:GHVL01013033.1.p1 GENE.GHVL01013033.1~~GHVL01013033.1.p1  ORF type:complete len:334 (+),score=76.93 GHVL01013033.1:51-1004(+)